MSLSQLKEEFSNNRIQQIELSPKGVVLESDNALFPIITGKEISSFHPFFEAIQSLLPSLERSINFPCVNVKIEHVLKIIDVEILRKKGKLFMLLFDFTEHYEASHPLVQEKNEASISKNKLAFEKRILQAKEEFKNSFLANLNHEIRSPLNSMLGFLEILGETKLDYDQYETLKITKRTGQHIKMLMDDMLDISKIEKGIMELKHVNFNLFHVTASIQKHFQLKHQNSKIKFSVNVDEEVHNILIGDPIRLKQILLNLIENAFRNTSQGSISLQVSNSRRTHQGKNINFIAFNITDTGNGILENKIGHVFDSYFQIQLEKSKKLGEGLGLKIVKDLVDLMEGHISVSNNKLKGVTFFCELPFEKRTSIRKKRTVKKGSGIVLSKRILIVEEDLTSQMLLMKTFLNNDKGFVLEIASNGQQALQLLEKKTYRLLILKNSLQDMKSVSLLPILKNHENENIRSIPVLIASGNTLLKQQQEMLDAGATAFLSKPYTKKELFKSIKKLL